MLSNSLPAVNGNSYFLSAIIIDIVSRNTMHNERDMYVYAIDMDVERRQWSSDNRVSPIVGSLVKDSTIKLIRFQLDGPRSQLMRR